MDTKRDDLWPEYRTYPKLALAFLRGGHRGKQEMVRYGGHSAQYYALQLPETFPARGVVVYIHGGGWQNGTPRLFSSIGAFFAARGFIAVLPGYRKTPAFRHPAQIEDVCGAVRSAADVLRARGLDCERWAVAGSSAGGHLGALLSLNQGLRSIHGLEDRICGLCSMSGVLSFEQCWPHRNIERMIHKLLPEEGGEATHVPADPIRLITGQERLHLLCIHGEGDPVAPIANAEAFFCAYPSASGLFKRFYRVPGGSHSEVAMGAFYLNNGETDALTEWLECCAAPQTAGPY